MSQGILVLNAGSSRIKFAGYRTTAEAEPEFLGKRQAEGLGTEPKFSCKNADGATATGSSLASAATSRPGIMRDTTLRSFPTTRRKGPGQFQPSF
jgi:acetate kinase